MKTKSVSLALCVMILGSAPVANAAPQCSIKAKVPSSARIFAKTDGQSAWHEYPGVAYVPDVRLDSGMTAQVVQHHNRITSITVVSPGQIYWTYTRYCYAGDGDLSGVSYEVRTQLGWGYRVEGASTGGAFTSSLHEFFRTRDGKPIGKPVGVADAPVDLHPTVYPSLGALPFAALLKPAPKAPGKQPAATLVSTKN